MNFGIEADAPSPPGKCRCTRIIRSESGNGSGRTRTRSMTEKIAVLAPIPRASARIATIVNPGLLIRTRNEWRTSLTGVHTQLYTDCGIRRFPYYLGQQPDVAPYRLCTRALHVGI